MEQLKYYERIKSLTKFTFGVIVCEEIILRYHFTNPCNLVNK